MQAAMAGSLKPVFQETVQGHAEIRNIFRVPKIGTVAGCYVTDGKINRNHKIRLVRDGVMVYSGKIHSLKRFKDDAREVLTGFECGLSIEGFNDIKVGDVIEDYIEEQVERTTK
jgi:translation initiation factor IF-2